MTSIPDYSDIVIAGGGMVGVSLALQLGAVLPESISIVLIESFPLPAADEQSAPAYHPSFDARSTALSYSSRIIYEQMQVWDALTQWLCPIERIHVSTKGRFGNALLDAHDHQWSALGYVVENAWLGRALIQALHRQGRVTTLSPASVSAVSVLDKGVRLEVDGPDAPGKDGPCKLQAGLLLVADGANSGLCAQLGVVPQSKSYGQNALIANIATARPHEGMAFERFTDEGPLAFLPLLPAAEAGNRSAVVWTLPPDVAAAMQSCPQEEFLRRLQERFGYRLGRLLKTGERHSYPLALVQSSEQVRQGVVVMGNAAHTLHPVAGQGFNLALRDIAELADVLAAGIAQGVAPGDLLLLQRYQQRQREDQARTIGFSDQVPALFMNNDPLFGLARDLAVAGLDFLPLLKREFVRHATGVAALGSAGNDGMANNG